MAPGTGAASPALGAGGTGAGGVECGSVCLACTKAWGCRPGLSTLEGKAGGPKFKVILSDIESLRPGATNTVPQRM